MDPQDTGRRLVWHGVLTFLIGLIVGAIVQQFTNPRMALAAHVGAITSGTFLIAIGLVWRAIPPVGPALAMFGLGLYGSYGATAGLVLAAIFGTSSMTPIAGAGHAGAGWQEALVNATFATSSLAMLAFTGLFLREVGRRTP